MSSRLKVGDKVIIVKPNETKSIKWVSGMDVVANKRVTVKDIQDNHSDVIYFRIKECEYGFWYDAKWIKKTCLTE
jgi:hypothetical protein